VSHRREQKERLRREREERERQARAAQQRKKMVGYGAAGVLVLAVAIAAFVLLRGGSGGGGDAQAAEVWPGGGSVPEQKVFDVAPAASAAGCALKDVKATSRQHIFSLKKRVKYSTNPPTSGTHYVIPAQDGIYGQAPQDEQLVHAQEHGRVIIWAKPSLPEKQRAALRALVDEDSYQMFLVPRANMPYPLAVTAWDADPAQNGTGKMMTCTKIGDQTYDAIRAFRDEHRSQGPEPVP
jgi:hypothetical protein